MGNGRSKFSARRKNDNDKYVVSEWNKSIFVSRAERVILVSGTFYIHLILKRKNDRRENMKIMNKLAKIEG